MEFLSGLAHGALWVLLGGLVLAVVAGSLLGLYYLLSLLKAVLRAQ